MAASLLHWIETMTAMVVIVLLVTMAPGGMDHVTSLILTVNTTMTTTNQLPMELSGITGKDILNP